MEECELYKLLKFILNIDISFIIKDILGPNFEDIDIPSNIDEEDCTIEVNTLDGVFTIHILNKDNKKEITFAHHINESTYEEYILYIDLNSKDNFILYGRVVEFREKGFIVNDISKKYLYNTDENKVFDLGLSGKKTEVYNLSAIDEMQILGEEPSGLNSKDPSTLLPIIAHEGEAYTAVLFNNIFETSMLLSILPKYEDMPMSWYPYLDINYDEAIKYEILPGINVVRRAYDLFEGKVTEENYNDAIELINNGLFNRFFAFYDYYKIGDKTINEIIDDLIGISKDQDKKEYSNLVKKVINEYSEHIKYQTHSEEQIAEVKELEKNNYIKEILLRNKNM